MPNAVIGAEAALLAFLKTELRYQLDVAVDQHVLAQLALADIPSGKTGTNLVDQVRNAVTAMRDAGANPNLVVLSGEDAAALDLTQTGSDDAYVFASRATGSASPLWGLDVVETAQATSPIVLDTSLVGVLYAQTGTFVVDPYSGLDTNVSRVRLEANVLFHVRDAAGAYLVWSS